MIIRLVINHVGLCSSLLSSLTHSSCVRSFTCDTSKQGPGLILRDSRRSRRLIATQKIWHGVHWEDLTPEQRKLILPMMKNYIEKYLPSGEFDKSKVRVLVRGDLQHKPSRLKCRTSYSKQDFSFFAHTHALFSLQQEDLCSLSLPTPAPAATVCIANYDLAAVEGTSGCGLASV